MLQIYPNSAYCQIIYDRNQQYATNFYQYATFFIANRYIFCLRSNVFLTSAYSEINIPYNLVCHGYTLTKGTANATESARTDYFLALSLRLVCQGFRPSERTGNGLSHRTFSTKSRSVLPHCRRRGLKRLI